MIKNFARFFSASALFLLMGSVTSFASPLPLGADSGPPPPQNYQKIIQSALSSSSLENLVSGSEYKVKEVSLPAEGYTTADPEIPSVEQDYGWVVCGRLHRRDKVAGYGSPNDGIVPFYVMFKNGKIEERLVGQVVDKPAAPNTVNDSIKTVCERAGIL